MTSLAERATMSSFDVTDGTNAHHEVTPGTPPVARPNGVALSVDVRGNGNSVVALSFLPDVSPHQT